MRKAERILKKCNEFYNLVSLAATPKVNPVPPSGRPGALARIRNPIKPRFFGGSEPGTLRDQTVFDAEGRIVSDRLGRPTIDADFTPDPSEPVGSGAGKKPVAPVFDPDANVEPAPAQPPIKSGYTYKVKRLKPRERVKNVPPIENGQVTLYVDSEGNLLTEYLPDQVKSELGAPITGGSLETQKANLINKEITGAIRQEAVSTFRGKWRMGSLSDQIAAAKDIARAYKGPLAGITAGGIATIMVLGGIYSLFTKKEPTAKDELGATLKEGAKISISSMGAGDVPSNSDLSGQVGAASKLAAKHSELSNNEQNKQSLFKLSSLLNRISLNLLLDSFIIDDPASQQSMASSLKKLNNSIDELFKENYLTRFKAYLSSKNDTSGVELISRCETGLANYRTILKESNSAAQEFNM